MRGSIFVFFASQNHLFLSILVHDCFLYILCYQDNLIYSIYDFDLLSNDLIKKFVVFHLTDAGDYQLSFSRFHLQQ